MADLLDPIGEFPARLFRVFNEERWARAFIDEGRLRFRPVQYFAAIEDAVRADPSEGTGHLQVAGDVTSVHFDAAGNFTGTTSAPGYLNLSIDFVNAVFVCCFSRPPNDDVRQLPWKFGDFAVRIDDPLQLARDITKQLTVDGLLRATPVVECYPVAYNKGHKVDSEPDHFTRTRLSFSQKPSSFAEEYEWRFASIDSRMISERDLLTEFYDVVIGHPLPYASLVTR